VRQHHNVTLAILALACTAFALQQTMVVPALPILQRDLGTTTTWVTWVLTVFLLVAAVATPIIGRLGDQYGKGACSRSRWRSSSPAASAARPPGTSGR